MVMKKILSMAVAALLACTVHAEDYNRVTLGYQSLDLHNNTNIKSLASDGALDGFKLGYTHGFGIAGETPLFLEVGADFNFNTSKTESTYLSDPVEGIQFDTRSTTCGITIPVSLAYKFSFQNGMWLEPYAGINLKLNLMGKTKTTFKNAPSMKDADMNWFKAEDMSLEDVSEGEGGIYYNNMGGAACKRFQFGGQVGVNVGYKRVNLNVAYQMHTPLQKAGGFKINTRALTVGVGYNF